MYPAVFLKVGDAMTFEIPDSEFLAFTMKVVEIDGEYHLETTHVGNDGILYITYRVTIKRAEDGE